MTNSKYKIEQNNQGQRSLWFVKQGKKVISHHQFKSEAENAVQRYIEDDNWNAMNRD